MEATGNLPFMPFKDGGYTDWGNTLKAFVRHFESDQEKQYFLRRVDLLTMLQLMEARNSVDVLTYEVIEELEKLINNPVVKGFSEFQRKIWRAKKHQKVEKILCHPIE